MTDPDDGPCAGDDEARIWPAIKERRDVCVACIGCALLAASICEKKVEDRMAWLADVTMIAAKCQAPL